MHSFRQVLKGANVACGIFFGLAFYLSLLFGNYAAGREACLIFGGEVMACVAAVVIGSTISKNKPVAGALIMSIPIVPVALWILVLSVCSVFGIGSTTCMRGDDGKMHCRTGTLSGVHSYEEP
jgi:hypothetical protein